MINFNTNTSRFDTEADESAYVSCIKEIDLLKFDKEHINDNFIEISEVIQLFSACGPTITRKILREWEIPIVRNPEAPYDKKNHFAVRKIDLIILIQAIKSGLPLYKSDRLF